MRSQRMTAFPRRGAGRKEDPALRRGWPLGYRVREMNWLEMFPPRDESGERGRSER